MALNHGFIACEKTVICPIKKLRQKVSFAMVIWGLFCSFNDGEMPKNYKGIHFKNERGSQTINLNKRFPRQQGKGYLLLNSIFNLIGLYFRF